VRLVARFLIAVAVASVPVGIAVASCGTSAAGIDDCREIESARCNMAHVCDPSFDAGACLAFYHDECLVGFQNEGIDGGEPDPTACVSAQTDNLFACGDAGADAGPPTLCDVLMVCPELLAACAFIATPPNDGGTDADAGEVDAAGDADAAD
jgi:hypothetical protein